jgi:hypothetical protein
MLNLFAKKKITEKEFWDWFLENEERFFKAPLDGGLVREIYEKIQRYADISVVIGYDEKAQKRELIITAEGRKSNIDSVRQIVSSAPALNNWKITAFRPKLDDIGTFVINGKTLNSENVFYSLESATIPVNINLYIADYDGNDGFIQLAFLLLDNALGEYSVMHDLGGIEIKKLQALSGLKPLKDLFEDMEELKRKDDYI